MSDKPDERLDLRIRQALDALPDGLPPGSAFDAGRLWEQLRPELMDQPVDQPGKKTAFLWWVAAASLASLLIGWWWQSLPDQRQKKASAYEQTRHTQAKERVGTTGRVFPESQDLAKRDHKSLTGANHPLNKPPVKPVNIREVAEIRPSAADSSALSALPLLAETVPDSPMPISLTPTVASHQPTALAVSKRRFRVVHENELLTEDEAYRIRHSTENRGEGLVRLGTGSQTMPAVDAGSLLLKLPLNRKSTQ